MKWTSEKEEYLINNWQYLSDDELAENIGATKGAIITKRRRLNLIRKEKILRNTKNYSYNEVKEQFSKKGYILIDNKYKNYTTKMKYICKKHSEKGIQEINLCDLLRDRGCYYCGRECTMKNKVFNSEHWKNECEKHNFTYVSYYHENGYTYVNYICNIHKDKGIQVKEGYTLSKCPGCPYCKKTFFESAIGDILDKWHINYDTQKRFSDCRDKNPLPFDYYIEDFNIAIEYDGEFHYKPVMLGKTLTYETAYENMINTQKRDNIKDTYCQDHKINLIRIPFWDQIYMEDILFDKLVEYGALIEE